MRFDRRNIIYICKKCSIYLCTLNLSTHAIIKLSVRMESILAKNGTAPLAAVAAGVTTHLGFFIRNEHHLHGLMYIKIFLLAFLTTIIAIVRVNNEAFGTAFTKTGALTAYYLGGLYTSLLVYRIFFHPLKKFPGPFGNKIGNL